MAEIKETEQWLLNGDCDKCRKNKYCRKACKPCKQSFQRAITSTTVEAMNRVSGGAYGDIMKLMIRMGNKR